MTTLTTPAWESKRTPETRRIEDSLRAHFQNVDSYRYNSAVIRVRVVDPKFEGLSREDRDTMVEQHIDQFPLETQQDILTLITFAPSDLDRPPATFKQFMMNAEFEDPSRSML